MYSRIASILLSLVALLHLFHIIFNWELSINGNSVPLWLSLLVSCTTLLVARKLQSEQK